MVSVACGGGEGAGVLAARWRRAGIAAGVRFVGYRVESYNEVELCRG